VELELTALERDVVPLEQGEQHLDALLQPIHALARRREGDAELAVLGLVPSRADRALDTADGQWSTVTTSAASTAGWRCVIPVTSVPSRTRDVSRARPARSVHASSEGPFGSP
jgi:hypothetical protein